MVEWPTHWDQGAWSLGITVVGVIITVIGVCVSVAALVQVGKARDYAEQAAKGAGIQGLIAAVSRLNAFGRELALIARSDNRDLAQFVLSQWTSTAAESLGLLTESLPNEKSLQSAALFRQQLNSSMALARVSQDKLTHSDDPVGSCIRWTLTSIHESVALGAEFLAQLRVALRMEAK